MHLTMSEKERRYLMWLNDVESGKVGLPTAAVGMGVSYRQARRLRKSFRAEGDVGLVHGLRGRASTRKTPEATRAATLARYTERYSDFGPTLAAEHLRADDSLPANHETSRLWLIEAGLWQARPSKRQHRSWRRHGVCQDRLIKEMRLAGVSGLEAANAFVVGWLGPFNKKFAASIPDSQGL